MKFQTPDDSSTVLSELTSPSLMDQLLDGIEEVSHGELQPGPPEAPSVLLDPDLESIQDNSPPKDGTQITSCMVTIFPDDQSPDWLFPATYGIDSDHLIYWCGQFEICPSTGKLHAHIFMKFTHKNRPRFNYVRSLFSAKLDKGCDIKIPRPGKQNWQILMNYCLKPDKGALPETQFILTQGPNVKTAQFDKELYFNRKVAKSDRKKKEIIDYLETRPWYMTYDQILHETPESKMLLADCGWAKKYHAGRKSEQPRRTIKQVIILFGAPGTGKTTMALSYGRDHNLPTELTTYTRNFEEEKFWGGGKTAYNNHPWILCEEFKGQETFSKLKQYTDVGKTGPAVAIKGDGTFLNHEGIIFASNYHPATWYRNVWKKDPVHWKAFWRRVTKVLFFPTHLPNGEMNRPGEPDQSEPFFEDMTDEFSSDMEEYEQAWDAFQSVWPTNEEEEPDQPSYEDRWEPASKRQRR